MQDHSTCRVLFAASVSLSCWLWERPELQHDSIQTSRDVPLCGSAKHAAHVSGFACSTTGLAVQFNASSRTRLKNERETQLFKTIWLFLFWLSFEGLENPSVLLARSNSANGAAVGFELKAIIPAARDAPGAGFANKPAVVLPHIQLLHQTLQRRRFPRSNRVILKVHNVHQLPRQNLLRPYTNKTEKKKNTKQKAKPQISSTLHQNNIIISFRVDRQKINMPPAVLFKLAIHCCQIYNHAVKSNTFKTTILAILDFCFNKSTSKLFLATHLGTVWELSRSTGHSTKRFISKMDGVAQVKLGDELAHRRCQRRTWLVPFVSSGTFFYQTTDPFFSHVDSRCHRRCAAGILQDLPADVTVSSGWSAL